MRLIFMGTPHFAVPSLRSLAQAGYAIDAVFTQPDKPVGRKQIITRPPVKEAASDLGIPVYQPESIKNRQEEFLSLFSSVDLAVVAAYGRILPQWMLSAPRLGCVNVHSSLLPKYRGAAPINWAIVHGETVTGVTIMQMDAGLDTGDMLLQGSLEIGVDERAPELTQRLSLLGAELLVETLRSAASGNIKPVPQDNALATYAPILKREDGLVDWKLSAFEIRNRVRGFTPFPGTYTRLAGLKLDIIDASCDEGIPGADPGTVIDAGRDFIKVACGDNTALRLITIQPAGKKVMAVRDFINGCRVQVGERLG